MELFAEVTRTVREHPALFREGGKLIEDRFSPQRVRLERAKCLKALRDAVRRGNMVYRKWPKRADKRRAPPIEQLRRAANWLLEIPATLSENEAKAVYVILWILIDPEAHKLRRVVCDLQSLNWVDRRDLTEAADYQLETGEQVVLSAFNWHRLALKAKYARERLHSAGRLPESKPKGNKGDDLQPLSDAARLVHEKLCSLPHSQGMTAKQIVLFLATKKVQVSEHHVRDGIRKQLESRGIDNKGSGYFIPVSRRPLSR